MYRKTNVAISEFRIDEKTHITERKKLHAMLTKSINPDVTFIVICEPLPEETEIKDCQEVGCVNKFILFIIYVQHYYTFRYKC